MIISLFVISGQYLFNDKTKKVQVFLSASLGCKELIFLQSVCTKYSICPHFIDITTGKWCQFTETKMFFRGFSIVYIILKCVKIQDDRHKMN